MAGKVGPAGYFVALGSQSSDGFLHNRDYARVFSWPDDPELRLIYSTLTGAKALVPVETRKDISNNTLDEESVNTLQDLGFLTEDKNSEKHRAANMVKEINSLRQVMNVSIVANLNCNFRCRYCYEGTQKGHSVMSADTAEQLITFIKKIPARADPPNSGLLWR